MTRALKGGYGHYTKHLMNEVYHNGIQCARYGRAARKYVMQVITCDHMKPIAYLPALNRTG